MKPSEIPDYTVYKVEDAPRLVEVQKRLAAKGLKDPWLRNEVWRFNSVNLATNKQMFGKFILPLTSAVVFVSLFVAFEKKFDIWKYDEEHLEH